MYRLVPIEPTQEMIEAPLQGTDESAARRAEIADNYRKMIEVVPPEIELLYAYDLKGRGTLLIYLVEDAP
jgi:hypothetical protein